MDSVNYNNQTIWRFNRDSGRDDYDGVKYPLKTWAEYLRRTGYFRYCDVPLKLYFETDIPSSDPVVQRILPGPNCSVGVIGCELLEQRKGVLTAVRQPTFFNAALGYGQPLGISDSNYVDWPFVGSIVKINNPAFPNQKAFISKNEGAIARLQRMTYRPETPNIYNVIEESPGVSNSYSVLKPRKISYLDIQIAGQYKSTGPYLYFENLRLPNKADGDFDNYTPESEASYYWCDFPFVVFYAFSSLIACRGSGYFSNAGNGNLISYFHLDQSYLKGLNTGWALGGITQFQGAGRIVSNYNIHGIGIDLHSASGGLEIYDSPGTIFQLDRTAGLTLRGQITGTDNIGCFATLDGLASIVNGLDAFYFHSSTNGNGAYAPGSYDFKLSGDTSLYAVNDNGTYTADLRDCTYPNLVALVAAGGFSGDIKHYRRGTSVNKA